MEEGNQGGVWVPQEKCPAFLHFSLSNGNSLLISDLTEYFFVLHGVGERHRRPLVPHRAIDLLGGT
jgi:hypothetical protein